MPNLVILALPEMVSGSGQDVHVVTETSTDGNHHRILDVLASTSTRIATCQNLKCMRAARAVPMMWRRAVRGRKLSLN